MKYLLIPIIGLCTNILCAQKPKAPTGHEIHYQTDLNNIDAVPGLTVGQKKSIHNLDVPINGVTAEEGVSRFIQSEAKHYGLNTRGFLTMRHSSTRTSDIGKVLRYKQYHKGLAVKDSEMTVFVNKKNRIRNVFSNVFEHIKLSDVTPGISQEDALRTARRHMGMEKEFRFEEISLLIYPDKRGDRLSYEITLIANGFLGEWHLMVDAKTGELFECIDKAYYYCKEHRAKQGAHGGNCNHAKPHPKLCNLQTSSSIEVFPFIAELPSVDGTGFIFDPDPLSSNMQSYGGNYVDNNDAANAELNAARFLVTLQGLDETDGTYTLKSDWAEIRDHDTPSNGLFQQNTSDFQFDRSENGFEAVNTFYHLDSMMRYINVDLNCEVIPYQYTGGVRFDPSGAGGADNSFYSTGTGAVTFGEGGVDDAEDSDVIHHELGHGLHDWLTDGGLSQVNGLSEGFGDYVAQSYNRAAGYWAPTDAAYHFVFNWDGHNEFWGGRSTNHSADYPDGLTGQIHTDGQIFATCMMRIWDQLGREKTDKAVFEGLSMTNSSASQNDAAVAILQAADELGYTQAELDMIAGEMTSTGYTLPVAPTAAFSPSDQSFFVCPNDSGGADIEFYDNSANTPTSWSWTFGGTALSSPTNSTDQNPVVTIDQAGTIIISLTASNTIGDDTVMDTLNVSIYTACTLSCMVFSNSHVDIDISEDGGDHNYSDTLEVLELAGTIVSVDTIRINVDHSYTGDLDVTLNSPSGTAVVVIDRNCSGEDNINVGLDDDAATALPCPMTGGGIHTPDESLSSFNGENPTGDWIMTIVDNADQDGGNWNSWEFKVCALQPLLGCAINSIEVSNITCSDNGTIADASDDTYTFDVLVQGSGGSSGFVFGGDLSGSGTYGTTSVQGPFSISGGDISFTVADNDDGSCTSSKTVTAPQTCSQAEDCETASATDLALEIPAIAGSSVSTTLSLSSDYNSITDVDILNVDIGYKRISHLEISLTSPENTTVILFDNGCDDGSSSHLDIGFDDDASSSYPCPPTDSGVYQSDSPLSAFVGEDINGIWTLSVENTQGGASGILNGWGITVCATIIDNCDNEETLTGTVSGVLDVEATFIESNQTLEPTARVDYDATQYVLLKAQFEVKEGALFEAFIDGCNDGAGGINE